MKVLKFKQYLLIVYIMSYFWYSLILKHLLTLVGVHWRLTKTLNKLEKIAKIFIGGSTPSPSRWSTLLTGDNAFIFHILHWESKVNKVIMFLFKIIFYKFIFMISIFCIWFHFVHILQNTSFERKKKMRKNSHGSYQSYLFAINFALSWAFQDSIPDSKCYLSVNHHQQQKQQ